MLVAKPAQNILWFFWTNHSDPTNKIHLLKVRQIYYLADLIVSTQMQVKWFLPSVIWETCICDTWNFQGSSQIYVHLDFVSITCSE